MVWFARWRPKFKKVAIATAIVAALAASSVTVKHLQHSDHINEVQSELVQFDEVRKETEDSLKIVNDLLIRAAEMNTLAESLMESDKKEEAKHVYEDLLEKYEEIIEILTKPNESGGHIALAKNQIIRIKEGLRDNKILVEVIELEQEITNVWAEVDRLTRLVSDDLREVEGSLDTLN